MSDDNERILQIIKKVLISCRQDSLLEGILADLIDDIPVIGGITNIFRIVDSIRKKDDEAFLLQSGDFILPMIPFVGKVVDDISMVNTYLTYQKLSKEGKLDSDLEELGIKDIINKINKKE